MFFQLVRLFYTIKDLRTIQVLYRIWYRLKFWRYKITEYDKYNSIKIDKLTLSIEYDTFVTDNFLFHKNDEFCFLSLSKKFSNEVEWNFQEYGKLWNYNLQYLDFILDNKIDLGLRRNLIKSVSISLLNGDLKPEPYPISLRINNLLIFDSLYGINCPTTIRALKLQIDFLKQNLEYQLLGNHLLENYISLLVVSYAIRDSKLNEQISLCLVKEISEQILDDGAHFERSSMYHSIILYRLLFCIDVIQSNDYFENTKLLDLLRNVAERMLGWLNSFSFPDGLWALVNDSAFKICLPKVALTEISEALGLSALSLGLKSSGFRKLVSSEFDVLINVGMIEPKYQPGHAHSDMLSFCMWADNKQLIVDTGVSTYEVGSVRERERSTISHNTISFDSWNQSDVWGGFRVGKKANIEVITDSKELLCAEIKNLYKYSSQTKHRRTFAKIDKSLIIRDDVQEYNGQIISHIHFDYSITPYLINNVVYFDGYQLSYEKGLREIFLESYEQALSFNLLVRGTKMTALVDNKSVFSISKLP